MSMERWLEGQAQKGNESAVAMGRTLLEQFGEIPLVPSSRATSEATGTGNPQEEAGTEKEPTVDLRRQTYEILSQMREPTLEEKAALEARGQVFLPIDVKAYAQVVAEDPAHFWNDELNYANKKSPVLRDYAMPVAASVGFNPTELAAPGSFDQPMNVQLEMAEALSKTLQTEFPNARVIMLPVTGYAQADKSYNKQTD